MISFPENWKFDEAHKVCSHIVDCINKTAPIVDYETPYKMIRTTNVKSGRIDLEDARCVDEATFIKWNRRLTPKKDDIVLTREAPLGDVGLLRSEEKVFLGQRTMLYRAKPNVLDQRFLYYTLLGPTLQAQLKTLGSGSTVEHVRVPDAEKLLIPYPELNTQKKIAAILSAYDDLIENNKRRIALLEKMAEEIYREWFVRFRFPGYQAAKFEKGIPKGWEIKRFRELVSFYIGGGWGEEKETLTFSKGAYVIRGTDIPPLASGNYSNLVFRYHKPSNYNSRKIQPNDFIFEVSGGSKDQLLGRNLMVTEGLLPLFSGEVICASFCKLIRFNSELVSPYFMKFFLKLYYDCDLVGIYQVQSTGISNYQFESFLNFQTLSVPHENIQRQFERIIKPIVKQQENLAFENLNLAKTKEIILPRLISGKLSVENLNIQFPPSMQEDQAA
jgi:type I restriction enzyme, S subunit